MKLGAFLMPAHPRYRSLHDGHYHDLDTLRFLDKIGFDEAWIGEHYTMPA
ncbi:LLM class flavin-dependent oxidoreductase [Serratia sp. CY68630]|nr:MULTISPECIES: LLM class flavin-dependent oxidoreductase [Serratia]